MKSTIEKNEFYEKKGSNSLQTSRFNSIDLSSSRGMNDLQPNKTINLKFGSISSNMITTHSKYLINMKNNITKGNPTDLFKNKYLTKSIKDNFSTSTLSGGSKSERKGKDTNREYSPGFFSPTDEADKIKTNHNFSTLMATKQHNFSPLVTKSTNFSPVTTMKKNNFFSPIATKFIFYSSPDDNKSTKMSLTPPKIDVPGFNINKKKINGIIGNISKRKDATTTNNTKNNTIDDSDFDVISRVKSLEKDKFSLSLMRYKNENSNTIQKTDRLNLNSRDIKKKMKSLSPNKLLQSLDIKTDLQIKLTPIRRISSDIIKEIMTIKERPSDAYKGSTGINCSNLTGGNLKSFSAKTQPGMNIDGQRKTNQDSFAAKKNLLGFNNFSLFSVFDGHGSQGHFISNNIKTSIINYFSNSLTYGISEEKKSLLTEKEIYKELILNDYELIKSAYITADHQLNHTKFDVNFSGTTAVTVLQIGNKIICANSGDSRAIMVKDKKNDYRENYEVIPLSRDHKPELADEYERVISSGGRVEKFSENGIKLGPYRVWLKHENFPGLAMSRSIGDFVAASVGVICEPEVFEFDYTEDLKYIVVASDGVWEFLSNKKIMDIVNKYYISNDVNGACEKVVEESTKCWKREDSVIDDITVVIAFFNI